MNKILMIEDDQLVANIYRNKLALEGYAVEIAPDGQAGLEMLRRFQPHVVILDLMMPKMSGVDVIKQVRALPEFQSLPIIVFSNTYLTNTVQQAWKAGATKCLSKASCSPKHLLDIIRSTLTPSVQSDAATAASPGENKDSLAVKAEAASVSPEAGGRSHPAATPVLRKSFVDAFPATLNNLRSLLQTVIKTTDDAARAGHLAELRHRIHLLTGNAGVCELELIATLGDALEAFIQELHDKPGNVNASTLRTLAGAIDCLGSLAHQSRTSVTQHLPAVKILAVDDEPISRRAIVSALEHAKLKAESVENPQEALKLLSAGQYDLILLDIDMPGMSGHELCSKLRELPKHKTTPVIFVTGLNGFEARANSMMSGGSDFIAKPFLFLELAVKALMHIIGAQLRKTHPPRPLQPA